MAVIRGSFADSAPVVSVVVSAGHTFIQVTAVMDTGFDGFAAVPAGIVDTLGLPLGGLAEVEYADGSIHTVRPAPAQITLGDEGREGLVHVTSGDALIGIDLLRAFRKVFVLSVSAGAVLLVDSVAEAI
jgi:clan AA aspartic protease